MSIAKIHVERDNDFVAVEVRGEVSRDEGRYSFVRSFESDIELTDAEREEAEEALAEDFRRNPDRAF
jgi:hypothetical protein